jgi:TonB family protein
MEAILNFTLKSGIGLLSLYLFYYALLRNQTSFRFNRLYLLLAPLVALSLPLVQWPALFTPGPAVAQALQAFQLNEVVVLAGEQNQGSGALAQYIAPANIAFAIYLLVALFLLYRFCRQLWHIRRLKAEAITIERLPDNVQVMQLQQPSASFAFLHYIFLSSQSQLSPREKQQVLAHELAHVQLGHTYDVLYYELLSVAVWFNPIIWFLKQELRNVHEFQADARVLEQHQPQEYVNLLSKEMLFNMGLPVGSYFQKPQVLRRLYMLQQRGKQAGWARPLLTLPLLFVLFSVFAMQQATGDIISSSTPAPASSRTDPEAELTSHQMPKAKDDPGQETPVLQEKASAAMPQSEHTEPYTFVEEMPQFRGGEAEMLKYLGMNVRYPKEAQEAKVEGIVVASFVVETDGTLSNIKIIKTLGQGTDEEVMRVIETMNGNWLPGKQDGVAVPVQYTLPMRFTLKN